MITRKYLRVQVTTYGRTNQPRFMVYDGEEYVGDLPVAAMKTEWDMDSRPVAWLKLLVDSAMKVVMYAPPSNPKRAGTLSDPRREVGES